MHRKELIDEIYNKVSWATKEEIKEFLSAFENVVMSSVAGEKIVRTNFGTFKSVIRNRKTRHDVNKKQWVECEPSKSVQFKVSSKFRQTLNK